MSLDIVMSPKFVKHLKALPSAVQQQVKKKVQLLTQDPHYPSLRTKPIQRLSNMFEFSVNMDIRVFWYYKDANTIYLTDIGHHDMLDRF